MNLAVLITVRTRLGIEDAVDDGILTNFIGWAGDLFEKYCHRSFERSTTATDEFNGDEREISLSRTPVESVTAFALKSTEAEGWVTESPTPDFLLRKGCIITLKAQLGTRDDLGRVTYTGGYVLPGTNPEEGQTALPKAIEQACIEQVAYWYQNRSRLGFTGIAAEGGSVSLHPKLELLPIVKLTLDQYVRYTL